MKRLVRKIVLSAAALTPGMAIIAMQEFALSFALMVIGLVGLIGVCAIALGVSPKGNQALNRTETAATDHPSLLTHAGVTALQTQDLDPKSLRSHLDNLITRSHGAEGFVTIDDQIAMVLAQVMARWRTSDAMQLGDDQARELWLVEQLLRSTPAEAGALAEHFTTPDAMLALRDRIASSMIT